MHLLSQLLFFPLYSDLEIWYGLLIAVQYDRAHFQNLINPLLVLLR